MKQRLPVVTPAVLGLAFLAILLHLYAANKLEYHRDELLYFALGYHPDWGYASVPPLIGWLAGVIRFLFGDSVLAVKLLPALLSGAFVFLVAAVVRELRGGTYATVLACSAVVLMPAILRTFHLFQPVHLDLLWWGVLTWLVLRYENSGERKYLLYLGAAVGLGLLTKYLVLLWVGGLLLGLLLFRFRTFREPYLYLGAGIALILFLPNLVWQVTHDWPVAGHMQALSEKQLVYVDRLSILTDQLLMAFAGSLLLMAGLAYLVWRRAVLAVAVIFTFAALLLLRGKSYYALGMYPALVGAGAVWWEKILPANRWRWILPAVIVVLHIPLLPIGLPVTGESGMIAYFEDLERDYGITPGRRWEDGEVHPLPQDYADQLGWQELKKAIRTAYATESSPATTAVYCENYGQAAAILQVAGQEGIPEPISFSDAFNAWAPRTLPEPFTALYYINDEPASDLDDWFARVDTVAQINHPYAREYGTIIYRYSQPTRPFNEFWADRLADNPSPY